MIYFWNDKQLARDLRSGAVSEKDKFIYLMIYIFVPYAFNVLGNMLPQPAIPSFTTPWLNVAGVILLLVGIWIFYLFYQINNKGDGVQFLERFICLHFPLSLRLFVMVLSIGLLSGLLGVYVLLPLLGNPGWLALINVAAVVIFSLCYYLTRLKTLFEIASGKMDNIYEHRAAAGL